MPTIRAHPLILEVNAALWARRPDRDAALDAWAARFDLVWLMGVWRRSQAARECALAHPQIRDDCRRALPDCSDADVGASPYAIAEYSIDPRIDQGGGLGALRDRLHRRGAGLIVDFVPNHVARDHRWTREHPEWLAGAAEVVAGESFAAAGGAIFAHGRDPHFAPWTDTAQIDISVADARRALIAELEQIAAIADGVRCDMAMLVLSDVFEQTWGRRPDEELWAVAIDAVRRRHPGFLFIAEAYWGLEERLLELGFDYCYDKELYDRLRWRPAEVGAHIAGSRHIDAAVHFIENHDEARAAEAFAVRSRAAAVCALTLPGARLIHDGQLRGRRRRLPVQLVREPDEPVDRELEAFYERLLDALDHPVFHRGRWQLLEDTGAVVAWSWTDGEDIRVIAVNLAAEPAPLPALGGPWRDLLDPAPGARGMLPAWGAAILAPGTASR